MPVERKKPILVLLPCECTLNLKRLAKAMGEKKAALAPHARKPRRLTGLKVGGISALALIQKGWDVTLDAGPGGSRAYRHQRGAARHCSCGWKPPI